MNVKHFFLLLFGFFLLNSCDSVFTPQVQKYFSSVYVDTIPEHSGFLLRSVLQRMFLGTRCPKAYTLTVKIETLERALEMGEDAKITLLHVVVRAPFTLTYGQTLVYQGQAVTYYYRTLTPSFYGQTTTQYYISQESAQQLAQQIFLELGNFFAQTQKSTDIKK
ncbi:hypothetical protein [Holospora curviuscula]|uniref:hypothetical protein n=1 Tax=Holospora curviuscula TaxID=1082868 RepID=UPI000CE5CA58|nr:hypothetical protein [Holospora curviuscula]